MFHNGILLLPIHVQVQVIEKYFNPASNSFPLIPLKRCNKMGKKLLTELNLDILQVWFPSNKTHSNTQKTSIHWRQWVLSKKIRKPIFLLPGFPVLQIYSYLYGIILFLRKTLYCSTHYVHIIFGKYNLKISHNCHVCNHNLQTVHHT